MKKYELLDSSYSYYEDMQIIFEEQELILWGDYIASKIRDESEYDYPEQPQNIEEALEILESANEFFIEIKN